MTLTLHGQRLQLLGERAVFWEKEATLLVADCHFGKSAAFRSAGLAVPEGTTHDDLARLDTLVATTRAQRLLVVGDFFHAPTGYRAEVLAELAAWRRRHATVAVTLVRGNHDRALHRLPPDLALETVAGAKAHAPFVFVHDPADAPRACADTGAALAVCGHLHPAVRLGRRSERSLKAPCFWLRGGNELVLPGFGGFTGGAAISPGEADRVFAVTDGRVLEVPVAVLA